MKKDRKQKYDDPREMTDFDIYFAILLGVCIAGGFVILAFLMMGGY